MTDRGNEPLSSSHPPGDRASSGGLPAPSKSRAGCVARGFRVLGAVVVMLAAAVLHLMGQVPGTLFQVMLVCVPVAIVVRIWCAWRRCLAWDWLRRPLAVESRPYLAQALNRWVFWGLAGTALEISVPRFAFTSEDYLAFVWVARAVVVLMLVLELFPLRRVYRTPNVLFALGSLYLAVQLGRLLLPPPQPAVAIDPPFRGEWAVYHGGRSALVNHHYEVPGQTYALDLDRSMEGPPKEPGKLESYAAWGAPLYAPADGKVIRTVNDLPDNPIGKTDEANLIGNCVILEIGPRQYVLMAHLQKGSVQVLQGDPVRRGQLLARCGNSGNTSEPHLHLQVQDQFDFDSPGLRTYPILFRGVTRIRNGKRFQGEAVDVRRNDRIIAEEPPEPTRAPATS
jgi:hypothetical protein